MPVRPSVYLTLHTTDLHTSLSVFFFLYLYAVTFIRTMSVFCVHMSVYSYVPVCLSTTFIYKLLYAPFYVSIFM